MRLRGRCMVTPRDHVVSPRGCLAAGVRPSAWHHQWHWVVLCRRGRTSEHRMTVSAAINGIIPRVCPFFKMVTDIISAIAPQPPYQLEWAWRRGEFGGAEGHPRVLQDTKEGLGWRQRAAAAVATTPQGSRCPTSSGERATEESGWRRRGGGGKEATMGLGRQVPRGTTSRLRPIRFHFSIYFFLFCVYSLCKLCFSIEWKNR
jgi:hypothetical protein